MENFVVSARKYRPANFKSVVGQSHITTTLKNAIQNHHLAQAFLFCGPRGVGKTTCARILAKTVNCENISDDFEACNECSSCQSFMNNNSMNIHELDAASNNSVDGIRNLVDQVRYAPQSGKYKIYIIDEVHMLSNAAFNAFLKTLEEPPNYALFILATTEKHKIIPTILSRCQIFDFNRIQVGDITQHLKYIAGEEGIEAEEEALHLIAQKADGALRDALSMFDLIVTFSSGKKITFKTTLENLHILDYDYYFRVTDELLSENTSGVLLLFNEILNLGFDGHNFITGLSEHFRNLLVSIDESTVQLMQVPETVQRKYKEQSSQTDPSFLLSALSIANQCDLNYKGSKNQRLLVELTLLKLAHLNSLVNWEEESVSDDDLKKKSPLATEIPEEKPGKKVVNKDQTEPASAESFPKTENPDEATPPEAEPEPFEEDVKPVEEKDPEQRVTPPLPKKTPSISLNRIKDKIEKPPEKEVKTETETASEENPYEEKQLRELVSAYAEKLQAKNRSNQYNILNRDYELVENEIVLELDNPVQLSILEEFRNDLVHHLRSSLKNRNISVKAHFEPGEEKKMIYTQKEKFEHLAGKQPLLKELKDKLGLDPDF